MTPPNFSKARNYFGRPHEAVVIYPTLALCLALPTDGGERERRLWDRAGAVSGSADKDERAALIRRLREGQCADNMGCGTMKMCVCANATDAADYLEKLAAVPECGRRFDLAASLKELRDRWASIVESQNWGDQFDGDFTTLILS